MPHWWTLCIETYPLRRLLLPSPSPSPFSFLRRSSPPLPSRLPFPRCQGSLGASSSTCSFAFSTPLPRPPPVPSRCFASSPSPTYSYTPSAAMQSVRIFSTGDIARLVVLKIPIWVHLKNKRYIRTDQFLGNQASDSYGKSSLGAVESSGTWWHSVIALHDESDAVVLFGRPLQGYGHSLTWLGCCSCDTWTLNISSITALFAAGDDVGEAIAMAANSVGLREMPVYEVEELEDCDWVLEVESQFKPIEVSQGLWIVPKWSQPPDAKALNVIIDPGLAFGTGEHPTTRLCLQWLHHVVSPGDRILDYGTGSGILSIAALKMGAAHAIGVDIDPAAISSAEYNASLNNLKPDTLQVYVASADGGDPVPKDFTGFDVVAANILLNPLVELAGRITGYCKPGGLVGVSGILVEQVAQVKETYSQYLEGMAVSYDNGWACVSGRKKRLIQTTAETSRSVELHS